MLSANQQERSKTQDSEDARSSPSPRANHKAACSPQIWHLGLPRYLFALPHASADFLRLQTTTTKYCGSIKARHIWPFTGLSSVPQLPVFFSPFIFFCFPVVRPLFISSAFGSGLFTAIPETGHPRPPGHHGLRHIFRLQDTMSPRRRPA